MMLSAPLITFALASVVSVYAQTYSATYLPSNAPQHSEQGQSGTNQCGGGSSQTSLCQNAYLNSLEDWCFFAPPEPGPGSTIGDTERIEVAWCTQSGHGTRVIPDGAISGAHFVLTPNFVQVTGVGDLTLVNIPAGDEGGELDPHGADGNGNPIGGLVFSSAFGELAQMHEWTNYMSDTEFCFRGCKDAPDAPTWCQHIYDVMGCMWNMPANYDAGVFESCRGDSGQPMGVYGTSTFHQGDPSTPAAHPIPASSSCVSIATLTEGPPPSSAPASSTTSASPPPSSSLTSLSSAPASLTASPGGNSTSSAVTTNSSSSSAPSGSSSSFSSSATPSKTGSTSTMPSSTGRSTTSGSSSTSTGPSPTGGTGSNGAGRLEVSGWLVAAVAVLAFGA